MEAFSKHLSGGCVNLPEPIPERKQIEEQETSDIKLA